MKMLIWNQIDHDWERFDIRGLLDDVVEFVPGYPDWEPRPINNLLGLFGGDVVCLAGIDPARYEDQNQTDYSYLFDGAKYGWLIPCGGQWWGFSTSWASRLYRMGALDTNSPKCLVWRRITPRSTSRRYPMSGYCKPLPLP